MRGIERYYFHKSRTPKWADKKKINDMYRASKFLGSDWHVDHKVPLISPLVCGLHCEDNLEIILATVNIAKGNHTWPDMWNEPQQLFDISFLHECDNHQLRLF